LHTHDHIIELLKRIQKSFTGSIEVYTKGSCFQLCNILLWLYPGGEIYYTSDHAITKINDRFYDITGEVLEVENYLPIDHFKELETYLKYRAVVTCV